MPRIGPDTIWLDLHGAFMFLTLIFSAFLFGAVYFVKDPDDSFVRRLRISGVVTFLMLSGLMITGIPRHRLWLGSDLQRRRDQRLWHLHAQGD